jgi:hypothetical protein
VGATALSEGRRKMSLLHIQRKAVEFTHFGKEIEASNGDYNIVPIDGDSP